MPTFFDRFREAEHRLPGGLLRPGEPATDQELAAAEAALGRRLPSQLVRFLRSWNGVDLFQETVTMAGAGPAAALDLAALNAPASADLLIVAESQSGDRFAIPWEDTGPVVRLAAGSDERWLQGTSLERWLDAVIAHEDLLYGSDGEFAPEVFEPDGEELRPEIELRRAERAARRDPQAAAWQHERGVALRRMGRLPQAEEAFARAAEMDPSNPWPWFDVGRAAMETAHDRPGYARAAAAFTRAAELESGPSGARLLAWAARAGALAGNETAAASARAAALARAPGLAATLRRSEEAARAEGDDQAADDAAALLAALEGRLAPAPRLRLTVTEPPPEPRPAPGAPATAATPAPRPRPAPSRRRSRPAKSPPRGGSRRGRSR